MKGEKKIVGQKIIKVLGCHDYVIATLENGMEIEIGGIMSSQEVKSIDDSVKLAKKMVK
jgi:alcohol dehydrogenase YqhD (iron-dependent ADH family)